MYKKKYKQKKQLGIVSVIITNIIISIVSIFLYNMYQNIEVTSSGNNAESNVQISKTSATQQNAASNNSQQITDIIERINSCVVGISKIKNTGNSIFLKDSTEQLGLGTGFIVSENGYVLTNQHVAGNRYATCYVTLENGDTQNGTVVWADADIDLAIVKINAKSLAAVSLGNSEGIKPGESVFAIGNPIGFEFKRTVTAGIISAVNRTIKIDETNYMEDLLQTDATINPGNSGGPLINYNGEVIGINSVKITSAEGIGFAIPINIVKPIIEKFISTRSI